MSNTWTIGQRSASAVCTTGTETPAAPVKASQTVAFSTAVAGNTVVIRGLTFTAIANGATPASTTEFAVGTGGTADTDTGTAFAAAVNANRNRLAMTAANASGTVTLTADDYGALAYTVTKTGTPITLGGATFSGGVAIVGVNARDVSQVEVFVEAASGQTVVNGNLACYKLNTSSMLWNRVPSADIAIGANALRCVGGMASATLLGQGWLAFLPSGVTISSGNATVYMNAVSKEDGSTATRSLT